MADVMPPTSRPRWMASWGIAMAIVASGCGRLGFDAREDATGGADAATVDAGAFDAGPFDAGPFDGGGMDAGVDGGERDAAAHDGGIDAPDPVDGGVDAPASDAGIDAANDAAGLDAAGLDAAGLDAGASFAPPTVLSGLEALVAADDPTLTGDRLELYFNQSDDIFVTHRTDVAASWAAPTLVAELSTPANESSPEVSTDGLTMFFSRDPGTGSSLDIFVSQRATRADAWGAPTPVAILSTPALDTNPAPSTDGRRVVLSRQTMSGRDLFESVRDSTGALTAALAITELDTTADDAAPMLALGGLEIVFHSNRAGASSNALYLADRPTLEMPFGPARRIVELDTAGVEEDPWLSEDGRHLVFARDGLLYETTR